MSAFLSALDLIEHPELGIDPITARTSGPDGYVSDELKIFRISDEDVHDITAKIYALGKTTTYVDLRSATIDAEFEDSIEQTPTFTLTVHDPDWELLNSGALDKPIDLNPGNVPHRWYRLDAYDVDDDTITMTFATRNAVYLAGHKKPFKTSRGDITRAQMIQSMLKKVKTVDIKMYCPQLLKKQKVAKLTDATRKARQSGREPGFSASDKITSKGQPATQSQRDVQADVIQAGIDSGAPGLVIVAADMTVQQESNSSNNPQPPNPPYVGAFQQNPLYWPATGDAYKDALGFYKIAIPNWSANPDQDLGKFISDVQGVTGSTNPLNANYDKSVNRWRDAAEHAVNAYSGIDTGSVSDPTSNQEYTAKYEFMVGPPDGQLHENYLGAMYRLADEVHWRAYWVADVVHYMSEEDLFKASARDRLKRFQNGVESIKFGWDRSKKVNEMTLTVRMERWLCPVGTVVVFDEGSVDVKGRWLVTKIKRSMFDQLGEITLRKPIKEKLEPRKTAVRQTDPTGAVTIDPTADPAAPTGDISGTPKDIIDNIVIPMALGINPVFLSGSGQGIISPAHVAAANALHTHLGSGSDHSGPYWVKWAADISTDWVDHPNGENYMNELARQLAAKFGLDAPWGSNSCHNGYSSDGRYRFQICYRMRTDQAGDHFNHVHFGVQDLRADPNKPPGGHP